MIKEMLLSPLFGKPLFFWGGLTTLALFIATFYLGLRSAPIKVHRTLAYISLALVLFHGIFGMILFL